MPEEADDALDRLLEAVEVLEGRIDLEGPVHEDAAEPRILGGVDELGLADGAQIMRSAVLAYNIGSVRQPSRYSFRESSRCFWLS